MSHLEKQAKTIKDFYQDCICQIISKGKHPKKFDEQQKWVPLKEAQKAFVDNEVLFKAAYIRITELEGKIEVAKAIMQEWFDSENWDESYDHEILCRLDIVLNDRKPSTSVSQEQKATTNG